MLRTTAFRFWHPIFPGGEAPEHSVMKRAYGPQVRVDFLALALAQQHRDSEDPRTWQAFWLDAILVTKRLP